MSNGYYNGSGPNVQPYTPARAEQVTAEFSAVAGAFDQLPDPDAIREARVGYVVDTGTANALVATLPDPAPTKLTAGITLKVKVAAANTGATTLNLNALGVKQVLRADGVTALAGGEIAAGNIVELLFDGDNFRALAGGRLLEQAVAQAQAAAASAYLAPGTRASSTTSNTLATGNQTFAIEKGKLFSPGQTMVAAATTDPTQQMTGVVTGYNATTGALNLFVSSFSGNGTFAAWTLSLSASSSSSITYGKVTGGGIATGGGSVSMDQVITVAAAVVADILTGSSSTKAVTPKALRDATKFAAVPYAATVILDGSVGLGFRIDALTSNLTLGDPINLHEGDTFTVLLKQDATGSRTLAFSSGTWVPDNARTFSLSTAANVTDALDCQVLSLSPLRIRYAISKGDYS